MSGDGEDVIINTIHLGMDVKSSSEVTILEGNEW